MPHTGQQVVHAHDETGSAPVRLSSTSTVPLGMMGAVLLVFATALLYMGRELQRLDTMETEVRTMRDELREVRTLLIRQAGR